MTKEFLWREVWLCKEKLEDELKELLLDEEKTHIITRTFILSRHLGPSGSDSFFKVRGSPRFPCLDSVAWWSPALFQTSQARPWCFFPNGKDGETDCGSSGHHQSEKRYSASAYIVVLLHRTNGSPSATPFRTPVAKCLS